MGSNNFVHDEDSSKQPCQDSETSLDWTYDRENSMPTTRRSSVVLSHTLQKMKRDSMCWSSIARTEEVTFVLRRITIIPKKIRSVDIISASIAVVTTKSDITTSILQESGKKCVFHESHDDFDDASTCCHTISDDQSCIKNSPHRTPKSRLSSPRTRRHFSTDSLAFMRNILLETQEKYEHDKSEDYWKHVQEEEISISRSPKRKPPSRSKSDDNALYKRKESTSRTFTGTRSEEKLTKQLYDDLQLASVLDSQQVRSRGERVALLALRDSIRSPIRIQRRKPQELVSASHVSPPDHNQSTSSMSSNKVSDNGYSLLSNSCNHISCHNLNSSANEMTQEMNDQKSNSSFSLANGNSKSSLNMSSFCSYSSTSSITFDVRERTITIELSSPSTTTSESEVQRLSTASNEVCKDDSGKNFITPSAVNEIEATPVPCRKDYTNLAKAKGANVQWVANLLDNYLESNVTSPTTGESPFPSSDDSCYTDATPVSNPGRSRKSNLTVRKLVDLISPKSPLSREKKKRMPYRIPLDMFPKSNRFGKRDEDDNDDDDDDEEEVVSHIASDDDSALEGLDTLNPVLKVKENKKKIPSIFKSISKRYFRR